MEDVECHSMEDVMKFSCW